MIAGRTLALNNTPGCTRRLCRRFLVGVQLVFEERLAQGLPHFPFALGGALPPVEANLADDGVDVGDEALDDDVRLFGLHLVEEFG